MLQEIFRQRLRRTSQTPTAARSWKIRKGWYFATKVERLVSTGKTVIREQYCRVPLFIQRAIYLEETLPEMAYVYIISPSGGILQGDQYSIDITLSNNALAHVTTQSYQNLQDGKKLWDSNSQYQCRGGEDILSISQIR